MSDVFEKAARDLRTRIGAKTSEDDFVTLARGLVAPDGTVTAAEDVGVVGTLALTADSSVTTLTVPASGLRLLGFRNVLEVTGSIIFEGSGVLDLGDCALVVNATDGATCFALAESLNLKKVQGRIVGNCAKYQSVGVAPNDIGAFVGNDVGSYGSPLYITLPDSAYGSDFPVNQYAVFVYPVPYGNSKMDGVTDINDQSFIDTFGPYPASLNWWYGNFKGYGAHGTAKDYALFDVGYYALAGGVTMGITLGIGSKIFTAIQYLNIGQPIHLLAGLAGTQGALSAGVDYATNSLIVSSTSATDIAVVWVPVTMK